MNTLTDAYQPLADAYPEMMTIDGAVRPHWNMMLQQLEAYGTADIDARWQRAQRTIRENGVTYNVYDETKGESRPWKLDPVPLMIAADEWEALSAGLIQRMQLLNLTLADLYSEQRLVQENILPAELIFDNPAFLRSCCQIKPPAGQYLTTHAVDLARTPDGTWRVVKDLTQSPPGAGYALENRLVVSRTFPTMYRDCRIERLAPHFAALRDTLSFLAGGKTIAPHIIVLSPGPHSSSYFEHAYIARYLGFTLAQGNDLTVRDNQVFLKTLTGLRKVDVILRRLADSYCDPLELEGESMLGVPGLVQAAAAGEVVVANALGSGLAETPAMLPYIPRLSEHLLGESPMLATLETLWCGQEESLSRVLGQFDQWVIKRAFTGIREKPVFVSTLSPEERAQLTERIMANPAQFIAQENIYLSSSPCWQESRLVARHTMLRAFIVATQDGWKVMPGGLVRTAKQPDSNIVSMESGGGSKDTWVQARGAVVPFSLLPREESQITLSRNDDNLSSRVADNLFWLGRYVQRADMQARLLRTILRRLTEETLPDGSPELPELLRTLVAVTDQAPAVDPIANPIHESDSTRTFIFDMIFSPDRPGNLHYALKNACHIGSIVRERISVDTWRILDRMERELHSAPTGGDLPEALDMLDRLLMPLAAFSGLSSESMTHGYGWRFMDMGFRMERAVMSAQILREMLAKPDPYEMPVLDAILEVANSSMTYRARYQSQVAPLPLLDLLLSDNSNPRSIAYQLGLIEEHVRALSSLLQLESPPELVMARDLVHSVQQCELSSMTQTDSAGARSALGAMLEQIIGRIQDLSTLINQRYLAHVQPARQLISFDTEVRP